GLAERERDDLALLGQRAGDALRHFAHLVGDEIADRGDVVRQVEMDAGDRVAHLIALADQHLALAGELVDEIAYAHFVVVIGALDGGDLVVHERLELGGAGKRPLDAIAHGRDLAANRLADRHYGFARHGLGLRHAHGDFRHRLGDDTHVLRAREHLRQRVEEADRHDNAGGDRGDGAGERLRPETGELARKGVDQGEARGGPGDGGDAGKDVRGPGRTAAERLEDHADLFAVVIGGRAQADGVVALRLEKVGRGL